MHTPEEICKQLSSSLRQQLLRKKYLLVKTEHYNPHIIAIISSLISSLISSPSGGELENGNPLQCLRLGCCFAPRRDGVDEPQCYVLDPTLATRLPITPTTWGGVLSSGEC